MGKTADSSTPNRIRVEVTERDIARAHVSDSYRCVVAQAVARTVPNATRIEVDTQAVRFTVDGQRRVYLTPYAVQGYVIAFDAGDPIEPFSFQLDRPQLTRARVRTAVGKAADRAADRARQQARRATLETPAKVSSGKTKTKRVTVEPRDAAKAAYAAVVAEHPGEKLTETPGRKPPPRVFRQRRRAYGHRLLRINRQDGELA